MSTRGVSLALLCLVVAGCGSSSENGPAGGSPGSGAAAGAGGSGGAAGAGGSGGGEPADAADAAAGPCGDLTIEQDLTVPVGETITVCAGSILRMADGATILVNGTLAVQGVASVPVQIVGQTAAPASWKGITIAPGGSLVLSFAEIRDAELALDAQASSAFAADHLIVSGSSRIARLASNGTLSHAELHGLGGQQQASPIVVAGASPVLGDTLVDGANGAIDQITVNGASSGPKFDHLEVTDAHCAFHFNQGSGAVITGSWVHDVAYGLMVIASTSTVEHSDFENNNVNIGACAGGSVTVTDDYFTGAAFDPSCQSLTNDSPAGAKHPDSGPRP